ncbi:MAG: hypothetical protein JNL51_10870 [Chitinophagaceae bacterium]|nr:hypothetical protein [Chitinophagaceae bacterium]
MKKTLFLLPICIFLLSASCKKSNEDLPDPGGPRGPNVLLPNSGYLVCFGKDMNNHKDTMTFYFSLSGQEMTLFGRPFLRTDDEIMFTNNSDRSVNIRRKTAHVHNGVSYDMFGIEENKNPAFSSFPKNKYLWTFFQKDESVTNHFVIKRDEGDKLKFTIESKAFPGYFLGVAKWEHATYPSTDRLVFTTTPVVFWFE